MKSIFSQFRIHIKKILPRPTHAELDDEIQFHLDMSVDKKVAAGMDPNKARREAHKEFGGRLYTKEACQMSWGAHRLDDLLSDLSLAFRRITKQPQYSLPIIIILAISMGVCATLFNVAQQTFMNPNSYPRANEVMELCEEYDRQGGWRYKGAVSSKVFSYLTKLSDTFASLGYIMTNRVFLYHHDEVREMYVKLITPETWEVFETFPRFGRVFTEQDIQDGQLELAVISYKEAKRLFTNPEQAIGESVRINDKHYTIIGVMPKDFRSKYSSRFWLPLKITETMIGGDRWFFHHGVPVCRLKKEISNSQFDARLKTLWAQMGEDDSGLKQSSEYNRRELIAKPHSQIENYSKLDSKTLNLILLALGMLLYLLGCLNTVSILMANLLQRFHEVVTSSALGAKRRRINQQLLTEYSLLFLIAGTFSLCVLYALTHFAGKWMMSSINIFSATWVFILLLVGIGSLLCGFLVFRKTHPNQLENRIRERQSTSTLKSRSLTVSVFVQCWLTVVLMLGSLLLSINVHRVLSADYGFEYRNRIIAHTQFPLWKFRKQEEQKNQKIHEIVDLLSQLPGVIQCAAIDTLPQSASQYYRSRSFRPDVFGLEPDPSENLQWIHLKARGITTGVFQTLGIRLIKGSWLEQSDTHTPLKEIVVEQRFVDEILQGKEPINLIFPEEGEQQFKIIGVVENVSFTGNQQSYQSPWSFNAYQLMEEAPLQDSPQVVFVMEVDRKHAPKSETILKLIRSIDQDLGVDVKSYTETIKERYRNLVRSRNTVTLLSAVTLLLAIYGFYSFLNYRVCLQKKDLGIRISLGAKPERLIRNYLLHNAIPVVSGLVMGCITLVLCIQPLKEQFTEIDPTEPLPYVLTVSILVCIYVVASIIPIMQIRKLSIREVLASNG